MRSLAMICAILAVSIFLCPIAHVKPIDNLPIQYTIIGPVDDSSAKTLESLGTTSIETRVTWQSCEAAGEDQWDWSKADDHVRILQTHGLKWTPVLVLGPAHSIPNWFRQTGDHFPSQCLEHSAYGSDESIWNPKLAKWIDRFVSAFAQRYRDSGVIESIAVEIQTSTSNRNGISIVDRTHHDHPGFCCGDPYAQTDFREFLSARYKSVGKLNQSWGTKYLIINQIDFPGRGAGLTVLRKNAETGDPHAERQWLDFIDWYRISTTDNADSWIASVAKHFPRTPVYLSVSSNSSLEQGTDIAELCRIAGKHGNGVRIGMQAADRAPDLAAIGWAASAASHYGASFGFDPQSATNSKDDLSNTFTAASSGATRYFRRLSGSAASPENPGNPQSLVLRAAPVVPVALWYPKTDLAIHPGGYFEKAKTMRDLCDVRLVDETLLRAGGLKTHRILVIVHGSIIDSADALRIAGWVRRGGHLIVMDVPKFESVEGGNKPEFTLFAKTPAGRTLGKGIVARVNDWDQLASTLAQSLNSLKLPVYDLKRDGILAAQVSPTRFLFLNTSISNQQTELRYQGITAELTAAPNAITEAALPLSRPIEFT